MIAVIDYGAGNLGSVYKAFKFIGADVRVTSDPDDVKNAAALVLPGVGAFGHCMSGLAQVGLTDSTMRFIESGRPFLGICVGLQMLFEGSEETGAIPGLGVLQGRVVRFDFDQPVNTSERMKVPHIGWNELELRRDSVLFRGLEQGERVYFVHSYFPEPVDSGIISARSDFMNLRRA